MDQPAHSSESGLLSVVEDELKALRGQVAGLLRRVEALESGVARAVPVVDGEPDVDAPVAVRSWLAHSAVLRRVATISFVLVIALVLRTLTDSRIVDPLLGVGLGIGYAALLMGVGWRRLVGNRAGQRVFPVCGAVLLCTLVLETHARFEQLGAMSAYGLLIGTLLVTALLGIRYRAPAIAEAGSLGAAITAVAIGFPVPRFAVAATILLLAMLAATAVSRLRRVAWLHAVIFALTLFFWLVWTFKLGMPLARGEPVSAELQIEWFLPALTVTFGTLLTLGFVQGKARPGPFWLTLPTWNVVWALAAAAAVVVPWLGAERWLGVVALLLAGLHLVLARSRAHGEGAEVAAAAGLAIAAMVAFVPATWLAIGSIWGAVPLWAAAALGMAYWSGRLDSGSLRTSAALLQVGAMVAAITSGVFAAPPVAPWSSAMLGTALAVLAGLHYRWTRIVLPTALYGRLSPTDRPGVVMLWASVAMAFGGLRVLIYQALAGFPVDLDNSFAGAQSVLLNTIAIAMMLLAHRRQSRALLGTAVLVGVLAAIKVFASDFLALSGIPLVLSVFSFGMTAAVGSLILGRWQKAAPQPSA